MADKKRVALIGCGTLGSIFMELFEEKLSQAYEISGILTRSGANGNRRAEGYNFYASPEELLEDKPDYAVEFAGGGAVCAYAKKLLEHGISFIAASIGALADDELYRELQTAAAGSGAKLYISSGAVGGFDVMRTMALRGNAKLTVVNQKSPQGLNGAPALEGRILSDTEQECIFRGSAREAIKLFPKNVNVAVAASIAASDVDRADVEVWSVPGLRENTHRLYLESDLGNAQIVIASKPDAANPRSSVITAWSTAALLANLASPVQFF